MFYQRINSSSKTYSPGIKICRFSILVFQNLKAPTSRLEEAAGSVAGLRLALVFTCLSVCFSTLTVRQFADICLFSTAQYKCTVAELESE